MTGRFLALIALFASRACALAWASGACVSVARADWSWSASEECLDEARARAAVESTLGAAVDEDVVVRATIEGSPRAWRAVITVRGPDGVSRQRELTSDARTCAGLDDAVVVVTALLIDEVRALPAPAVLDVTPVEVETAPPEVSVRVPSPGLPWAAVIRLEGMARIDELPGVVGAPQLAIEITPPGAFPLLLSIGVAPPVEARVDPWRGGRFYGALLSLGACPAARLDPALELGGCGALAATYMLADGVGVSVPQHAEGLVLSIEGSFFGRVHIAGPLWMRASVGLLVPLVRPRATIQVGDANLLVHEVAPVVPEGSLGMELRFP